MGQSWFNGLFILAIFLLCSNLQAQLENGSSSLDKNNGIDVDLQQSTKSSQIIIPQAQYLEQVFEKAIDPEYYFLGPGDQLLIKIWGILDAQYVIPVSPEGYVIIPSVGEVQVAGSSLISGSQKVENLLGSVFKRSQFSIRLVRLRKFRIFVTGEVQNPGTYYLRAVDRVSDAVQLAGGLAGWGDDTRIQLRHLTRAKVDTVNISEFYQKGDLHSNAFLDGGDIVYVPPIDLTSNYVIIEGNVGSQGIYQIHGGETLFNFLTRLRTINRQSNIEKVVLIRNSERIFFNLLDPTSGARELQLSTGDRVIVPTNQDKVYVQGEVLKPGALPYLANFKAADYAGLAGMLETARGLDELYIIRNDKKNVVRGRDVIVQNGDIVVVPRKRRETFKDYLTILTPIVSVALSAITLVRISK